MEGHEDTVVEDIVDDFLLEEGLTALESSDQCWGAALTRSCGRHTAIECTPGFVRGKNHLKNKFCDACRRRGVFVRVDRVWVLEESVHDEFTNRNSAGLWTSMPTHPSVGFRVINQSNKCKGPRMCVCNGELPAAFASSCTPPDNTLVIHGRWVHLRVSYGTLVPSSADERSPALPDRWWWEEVEANAAQETADGLGGEHDDDRGTKRARLPESFDTSPASLSSPTLSGCGPQGAVGDGDAGMGTLSHLPPAPLEATGAVATPPLDTLLTAHMEFAARLASSLGGQLGLSLSSGERMALTGLLHHVRVCETLLRTSGDGGGGDDGGDGGSGVDGGCGGSTGEAAALSLTEPPSAAQAEALVLVDVDGLLSWPPSPPGTALSSRRPQESTARGGLLPSSTCQLPASQPLPTVAGYAPATPGRAAVLYFHVLVLCASALGGQGVVALLTSLFPAMLCQTAHSYDDPPIIATYAGVVSIMLAGNFALAEAVGLVPIGCVCAGRGTTEARTRTQTLAHPALR